MLLKRNNTDTSGDFFAIWPRRTPDGWRAFERLHWEYVEGWGWGSDGYYEYSRLPDLPVSEYWGYSVPGKTCTYPHCTCMIEHGSTCPVNGAHS
jgi:hypothetical protein